MNTGDSVNKEGDRREKNKPPRFWVLGDKRIEKRYAELQGIVVTEAGIIKY